MTKLERVEQAAKLLFRYDDFVTEERWNEEFDLPFEMYLSQVSDSNMRIFMGKGFASDYKITDHRVPRTEVKNLYPNDDIEMA